MTSHESLHIVITGGTGLIGTKLTELLLNKGYRVRHLGRHRSKNSSVGFYKWDPAKDFMDTNAIRHADFVVNLAGESIAGKRWTEKRKQEIVQSRLQGARLLRKTIAEIHGSVKGIVCASAVGFYGDRSELVNEKSEKGTGFLADTVEKWEQANSHYNTRTVILRFGNVLSRKGGVLPELEKPLKFFVNPIFDKGSQFFPWIHIDDLCNIIICSMEQRNMTGTFNAVAPGVVTQKEFMLTLKGLKQSKALTIPIPSLVLKLVLGEQAALVLEGANVSSGKILQTGFQFQYVNLQSALKTILNND